MLLCENFTELKEALRQRRRDRNLNRHLFVDVANQAIPNTGGFYTTATYAMAQDFVPWTMVRTAPWAKGFAEYERNVKEVLSTGRRRMKKIEVFCKRAPKVGDTIVWLDDPNLTMGPWRGVQGRVIRMGNRTDGMVQATVQVERLGAGSGGGILRVGTETRILYPMFGQNWRVLREVEVKDDRGV